MTYSITGRCARTGDVGFALATFSFLFGPMQDPELRPSWWVTRRETGAVTCQAETRFGFALKVFEQLQAGESASTALQTAMANEPIVQFFQVAVVDSQGGTAAYTGDDNLDWKGHLTGDGWAAAGNILAGDQVVQAMGGTFQERANLDLAERLLAALAAGRDAGGDRRGTRNGIIQVASEDIMGGLSLRAWEQDDPIGEMARLVALARTQSEFLTLAQQAARRFMELLPGSGLDLTALLPLSLREAVVQVRQVWAADPRVTPADLKLADRLLAALEARPDMGEQMFGPAISLLPSLVP